MLKIDFKRVGPRDILAETDISRKAAMMQYLAQQCRVDVFDILHNKGTGHWEGEQLLRPDVLSKAGKHREYR
ncbi:MAG: hypothetical protein ACYSUX_11210 [Planctomycetota bacterium]|jgi:hypothetical protein